MNRAFLAYADEETRAEWGHMDERYARFKKEFKGLGCRAFNCFYLHREDSDGLGRHGRGDWSDLTPSDRFDSVEKVRDAIADGRLHPHSKERPSRYGKKAHIEVCRFVGLPGMELDRKRKRLASLEEEARRLRRELSD